MKNSIWIIILSIAAVANAEQVKEIARKECNDKTIESQKITHRGQLHYYKITTQHCNIAINALDGAVIQKDIYE